MIRYWTNYMRFLGFCNHNWIDYDMGADSISFVCKDCNAFKKIALPPEEKIIIPPRSHNKGNVIYINFERD